MDETTQQTEWYTLSEASKVLGVHPATVRQWSDEGKIGAFRTPGGHRRFVRADIERMLRMSPVRGAGLSSFLVDNAVERTRKGLPGAFGDGMGGQRLPEADIAQWRVAGRRLVSLAAQLVTRAELSDDQVETGLAFGRDYGRSMAQAGYRLPDAVIAFLYFRDSLLETVLQLPETTGLQRDATHQIVGRVNRLLNDVLRAMMDTFEQYLHEAHDEALDSSQSLKQ